MEVKSADHHKMQHNHHQESEEEEYYEEDRLSFCDLPIYCSEEASQDKLNEDHQGDFFEFFSQEPINLVTTDPKHPVQENIAFCGKLIPSGDLPVEKTPSCSTKEITKKRRLLRWKSKILRKPRSDQPKPGKDSYEDDLSVVLASPPKLRWVNALLFGLVKFPEETDLTYAKNREEGRRNPAGSKLSPEQDIHSGKVLGGLIWALRHGSDPITTTGSTIRVASTSGSRFGVRKRN